MKLVQQIFESWEAIFANNNFYFLRKMPARQFCNSFSDNSYCLIGLSFVVRNKQAGKLLFILSVAIYNKYLTMFFYGMPCNYYEPEYTLQPYAFFIIPEQELEQKISPNSTNQDSDQEPQQKQISVETMTKQLEKRHKRAKSRFWSEEEDEMLMGLAKAENDWEKIAKHFKGKDMNICRRRYERLLKQNEKWPKESEELIKRLFQEEKLSWLQIQKFLPMYTKKQIKERYKNFLQVKIKRAQWTIQEDLKLWQEVKKHGNKWVNFTKLFEGRSQLQLKNRYNKLIRPLEESVLNIGHSHEEEECSDESWHMDN